MLHRLRCSIQYSEHGVRPRSDPGTRCGSAARDLHASADVAGGLSREAATAAGLVPGTPVVYGGSDQAAQALGHGVLVPGVASSTIGTGGQIFAPTARPVVDVPALRMHSYCHLLPDLWHVETAILSAGLVSAGCVIRWWRDPTRSLPIVRRPSRQEPAG